MNKKSILIELLSSLKDGILSKWYPLSIDKDFGGYFSNISYDWKILQVQDKMIVTRPDMSGLYQKPLLSLIV